MPRKPNLRFAVLASACCLAFALIIKLPTLKYPVSNWDELIYLELSRHWLATGSYSLAGSDLLNRLPRSFYDHPVFHHPPGFSVLRQPIVRLLFVLLPGTLLLGAWFLYFHERAGVWLPYWMRPDEDFLQANPFVAASATQSVPSYLLKVFACIPFFVVFLLSIPFCRVPFHSKLEKVSSTWIFSLLALFALLGSAGFAKEARYLAPVIPVVCWLLYARYDDETQELAARNDQLFPLFLLATLAGGMLAGYYLLVPQYDEILSPVDLLTLIFAGKT